MAGTETKRIIELTEASTVQSGDFIAVDSNARGTKKVPTSALATSAALTAETNARAGADEQMSERMDGIEEQTALIQNPTKTLSGALCSFTDGAEMPMVACTAQIEPQQSGTGTPSPDNVRQISGRSSVSVTITDRNLADYTTFTSGYIASNGVVNSAEATTQEKVSDYIEIEAGSEYNFSATVRNSEAKWIGIGIYDSNKSFIKRVGGLKGNGEVTSQALTASDTTGAKYVRVSFRSYGIAEQVSLTKDTTTTTTSLGRTVYGGTLDVVSGVLTVDRALYTPVIRGVTQKTNASQATTSSPDLAPKPYNNTDICSAAVYGAGAVAGNFYSNGSYFVMFGDKTTLSTVGEWQNFIDTNNVRICYKLATPQTYQLTPTEVKTLLGENNVWADSGDVEITYRRDISIVINNLESALNG